MGQRRFINKLFTFTILCIFLGALSVVAEDNWRGSCGWGPAGAYNKLYDTKTVETISGEVMQVEKVTPQKGMSYGVHVILKTEKETIPVHLGPSWYLDYQDTKIEEGDRVEVTGSRITYEEKPALIAAEVKKGELLLKLRDEAGFPLWSGWRRRR